MWILLARPFVLCRPASVSSGCAKPKMPSTKSVMRNLGTQKSTRLRPRESKIPNAGRIAAQKARQQRAVTMAYAVMKKESRGNTGAVEIVESQLQDSGVLPPRTGGGGYTRAVPA